MSKNKKIHILQVVHSLIIGGTERVVCDLTRAFNNDEFRTSVCCIDGLGEFGQDLLSEGFSVDVFARRPGVDTSLIYQLRKIYKKYEIDIIHAHQYTPYFYAASAAFFSGRRPVIFTEHGRHYPDFVRPKRAVINQALRLTTSAYTGVSEFTRQSLVSFEKMPSHRMQVIYNGIWSNGDCTIADRNALRESLGIGASNRLVLSVGRMDPVKDFETLIRAFASVAHEIPGALLWIAGGGNRDYQNKLNDLAKELGIEKNVALLGSRRDVQDLMNACDVFALCSITEATAMTILEAMSAGRAVIATKTGGNPELVSHGDTGLVVDVGDSASVSDSVLKLLRDDQLREKMGIAGRRRMKEFFSMERIIPQYRQMYLDAVGRRQ